MKILNHDVGIINSFLDNFKDIFSNKQFTAFKNICYASLKDYKRFNLSSVTKNLNIDYQRLQYFLSEANWNENSLNTKRINVLKSQRTTGFSKHGLLAIDDTGNRKPYALNTEGAKIQHCPSTGKQERCNIAVSSCFVNNNKHIPLGIKFYQTMDEFSLDSIDEFKSKLELAQELIRNALEKNIPFSYVVFDTWYGNSTDLAEFINQKNLNFISEVKSNRYFEFRHPVSRKSMFIQQDELVTLIKKHYWDKTRFIRYKEQLITVYPFKTRLKGCMVPVKAFCVFGKLDEDDQKNVHILISNDLNLSYKKSFFLYKQRWGIEKAFRELKDNFYFDQYQLRHKHRILRWWFLSILVWSLVYWIKQNAYLSKILSYQPQSFGEYKQALLKLIIFSSYCHLSKNKFIFNSYFSDIISQRFKNQYLNL